MKKQILPFLIVILTVINSTAQSTPAAGDIIFTHADADGEIYEFFTLTRLNLNNLAITDNGICSNARFRINEGTGTFPASGFSDVPAGTFVRINWQSTNGNETNTSDGVITVNFNIGGLNASGEQVIAYTGTGNGAAGCGGSGTNSYVSGINWGNSGWITSSTPDASSSYAPGTSTDFGPNTTLDEIYYNGSVTGDFATIRSTSGNGVRNFSNWDGTNTGGGAHFLKDIKLNESDYSSGSLAFSSVGTTSFTINASGLSFASANSLTRYMVVIRAASAPDNPVDRYTCYSSVSGNFSTAPDVVTAVTTPPCTSPTSGNGKVVYFGYTLPSSLSVTNLTPGVTYHVEVFAVNGNGYSANMSATPASGSQATTPITYNWNVASGNWNTAASWSPSRTTPLATDVLVFNGSVQANPTVTVDVDQTVGQISFTNNVNATFQTASNRILTIDGGIAGTDLSIAQGCSLTVTNTVAGADFVLNITSGETGMVAGVLRFTATGLGTSDEHRFQAADASAVTVTSTGTIIAGTDFDDKLFGDGNTYGSMVGGLNSIVFQSGATYRHQSGLHPFGYNDPQSAVVFQNGSNYIFEASSGQPSFGNRTYGNVEINSASSDVNAMTANDPFVINGNLTITAAGGSTTGFNQAGGGSINGNIHIAAGQTLSFAPSSAATFTLGGTGGTQTISSTGTLSIGANANITVGPSSVVSLGQSVTIPSLLTINGKMAINANTLTLSGTLAGLGSFTGSTSSNLIVNGSGALGTIYMDATTPGTTNVLNNFTFNRTTSGSLALGNAMQVAGVVTHTEGTLTTNNHLLLIATSATAYGQIAPTGTGSITGNVTAQYLIPSGAGGKWRTFCSPFTGNTLADLADDIVINTGTPDFSYINAFKLDESLAGVGNPGAWQAITSTTQSMDDIGFSVYAFSENFATNALIDFSGTYSPSDYTTPALSRTGTVTDTTGYHLIRNPWPSNYLHNTTITNLVANTLYVYDGQTVRDYNGSTGSLPNGVVPPFHAIMVEINSNGNTLTLPTSNRVTANSANYLDKTGLTDYVAMKVTNTNGDWDETRIYTDAKADNGKDYWDANKIINGKQVPTIYTLVGREETAINLMKEIPAAGVSIPVVYVSETEGQHTMSFSTENISAGIEIYLEDLLTGRLHKAAGGNYTFAHSKNNPAQRFVLHYRTATTATNITSIESNSVFVGSNSKNIVVGVAAEGTYTIEVFDIVGKLMTAETAPITSAATKNVTLSEASAGYYVVKVTTANTTHTAKVYLQ